MRLFSLRPEDGGSWHVPCSLLSVMIRIRMHGRGGQGVKTAARIVGTAAFLEGFTAQDSPLYGGERRGAPVAAFARIARGPIRERGLIARPDLVLVADETLLDDPAAGALAGATADTVLFINTAAPAATLAARYPGRATTLDLTGLLLDRLGRVGPVSASLGAAAARLAGLSLEHVRRAVVRELGALGLSDERVRRNLELADSCFQRLAPASFTETPPAAPAAGLWTPAYEPPERGSARIAACGNSLRQRTGHWRTFRPVLLPEKCNGCTLCFVYCPEAAIALTDRDRPRIDYEHCKGCLLCVEECPTKALVTEREAAAQGRSLKADG